jgi:DNA primase
MSLIPKAFIDELLDRIDMPVWMGQYLTVKKMGRSFKACCPFHHEKTPSFNIDPKRPVYYCFGCGATGNALTFLREHLRLNFAEAVELLASQHGMSVPHEEDPAADQQRQERQRYFQLLGRVSQFYQQQLRKQPQAIEYLKGRGLTGLICKQYGVGFAPAGWDHLLKAFRSHEKDLMTTGMLADNEQRHYDRFRDRIMFPIRNRRGLVLGFGGRIIGAGEPKYLNSPETPIFHKGSELYGLYEALEANAHCDELIIVEGYLDVISLAQYGITSAVATLGTAVTEAHIQKMLKICKRLIFCFDGDAAGQKAAWRGLQASLAQLDDTVQIQFMLMPPGEDPDSYVRREGKEAFMALAAAAPGAGPFLFQHLGEQQNQGLIDGKAGLIHAAAPYLQQIPGLATKALLQEQLATLVHMDSDRLTQLMNEKSPTPLHQASPQRNNSRHSEPHSTLKRVSALLLKHPQLKDRVPTDFPLATLVLPDSQLLRDIYTECQSNIAADPQQLLHYWPNPETKAAVTELYEWDLHLPPEGLESEFQAGLKQLLAQQRQQTITHLLLKANQGHLSDDEKQQLHQLIRDKSSN